ncbi:MAG: MFS transporter [Chitinophagaceae bacterium]|nr:MAG: MFS transporter [Chitinophagaceae bacterium]
MAVSSSPPTRQAINSVKSIFLVCGLGMSCWAPMVPYAKDRLQLNESGLGLLLLLLGAGAITMMPVTGWLAHRYGSRIVILIAGVVLALALPALLLSSTPALLGLMLFIFGAAVGTVDVAMNAQAVQVQNLSGKTIMSSLHGLFSVGGLFGALGLGMLISTGLHPVWAASGIAVLLIIIVCTNYSRLLDAGSEKRAWEARRMDDPGTGGRSWLNGTVLFLGAMCFIVFLAEGSILDWSAVFLRDNRSVTPAFAGSGYAAFSVAMAIMRLMGDRIVSGLSSRVVVVGGALIGGAGLLLAVTTPWTISALTGFVMLGIGAANIVPVFFSEGGRLPGISPTVAIPAITTMGYAGQLAGPAALGFIAQHFSLPTALGITGILLILVAIVYTLHGRKSSANVHV